MTTFNDLKTSAWYQFVLKLEAIGKSYGQNPKTFQKTASKEVDLIVVESLRATAEKLEQSLENNESSLYLPDFRQHCSAISNSLGALEFGIEAGIVNQLQIAQLLISLGQLYKALLIPPPGNPVSTDEA